MVLQASPMGAKEVVEGGFSVFFLFVGLSAELKAGMSSLITSLLYTTLFSVGSRETREW